LIRSMTGYGRGEIEEKGVRVTAEIRSLNNRFFEMVAKVPRFLSPLEDEIKKVVQSRISRGRILLTLSWEEAGGLSESVVLDEAVADRYHDLLKAVKERYGLTGEIDVSTFAALPDLLKKEVKEWEPTQAFLLAKEALEIALDDLIEMKSKEGSAISRDLEARINLTLSVVGEIEERAPEKAGELRRRLKARLAELGTAGEVSEALVAQEVVLFAERSDTTEECVRYRVHCKNFVDYLAQGGAAGRKLNFLLQEMAREANTMGSKAGDAQISQNVVLIKEELEKIREQVQNIE
jgi:uncharacterized protein (TIGR00255 family)